MNTTSKRTLQGTVGAGAAAILLSMVPQFEGMVCVATRTPSAS